MKTDHNNGNIIKTTCLYENRLAQDTHKIF